MEIFSALVAARFKARIASVAARVAVVVVLLLVVAGALGTMVLGGAATSSVQQDSVLGQSVTGCGTNVTDVVLAASSSGAEQAPSLGGAPMTSEQVANAEVIVAVGKRMGVPQLGLEAALMTAITESGLRNVGYGDRDSVGLFQQRPSAGWGTVAQIMQPDYAATRFYQALVAVPGYESMAPEALAQAVQRSAFPDRYAGSRQTAEELLGVRAVASAQCLDTGGSGVPFGTGTEQVVLARANPRTVEQAVTWAQSEASSGSATWYRACLSFVAQAYGWGFSGTYYAIDQYTSVIPVSMHHDGDRNPPPGALLFWETSSRAGHVALYLGDGKVASNDILADGQISVVPASLIEEKWGAKYVGWAPPYFPGGG